jgi:hypothetical protein
VGNTGFEVPPKHSGEIEIAIIGGAESGARSPAGEPDTLLAFVIRQWPQLAPEQRLRILEIATTPAVPEPVTLRVASHCDSDGSSPRPGKTKFRRRERQR